MHQQIAAEIAAPMSQAKKLTMVSNGSSEVGPAKLTGEVMTIMTRIPEMVKILTGVDVTKVKWITKHSDISFGFDPYLFIH